MEKQKQPPARNIDEYISQYEGDAKDMLTNLRVLVHEVIPDINEKISWEMPTFYASGIVIQFAAHKAHIGVYTGPEAIEIFKDQISQYKYTKGGFQLPYGKPIPHDLMRDLILYRQSQEEKRALERAKKKKTDK